MKKSHIIAIIAGILLLVFFINLIYLWHYFREFNTNVRFPTNEEMQKTIGILNKSGFSYSKIEFINVYTREGRELVYVKLTVNDSTKTYSVNLKSERIDRR